MSCPVIILGWGGHAHVLYEILKIQKTKIQAIAVPGGNKTSLSDYPKVKIIDDQGILAYLPSEICLVNGLGSVDVGSRRQQIFQEFKSRGYCFLSMIHPSAIIASDVQLSEGVQIMAGAIIQPGGKLGNNVLINTGAIIDHDCLIGDHVHIAPGAVLSGNVNAGKGTHIGTGTSIINNISIGANCTIGAGTVIIEDVPSDVRLAGVPARVIGRNQPKEV